MARKRRSFELFSVSFLDCICCGFGAMLLLFVLTIGRQAESRSPVITEIQKIISLLERDIEEETKETERLRSDLTTRQQRLALEISNRDVTKRDLTELQEELALMLQQRSSLKEELERLLGEKKDVPKEDARPPIPIPNTQRRQYLTGMNFDGNYVVIMVEASGGMLGYTVDEALDKTIRLSDEEKRKVEKWRRVVRSVHWIIANLTPRQVYQVLVFNSEATLLLPDSEGEWFEPQDQDRTMAVLKALEAVTPRSGANLERAFVTVQAQFPSVDSIVLLTDSLPTLSDSLPNVSSTDDRLREDYFRAAIRQVPRQTPVNTILYPMQGDPAAPYLFWRLADATKGALISPAPGWPDI